MCYTNTLSRPFFKIMLTKIITKIKPLILCVCSGNMGRSPIMEVKLKQLFYQHGLAGQVRIDSVGIQGTGETSPPKFLRLAEYPEGKIMLPMLAGRGLDVGEHTYQPATKRLVQDAAIILIPSEDIRSERPNALAKQFPQYREKMVLLSELVEEYKDVPDFGDNLDPAVHRRALEMICDFTERGFERLVGLLGF